MSIKLELGFFNNQETPEHLFKNDSDPRIPLIRNMLEQIEELPDFKTPRSLLTQEDIDPEYDISEFDLLSNQDVLVKVILIDDPDLFSFWNIETKNKDVPLGLHCITSGALDLGAWGASEHACLIYLDQSHFKKLLLDGRDAEVDPYRRSTDLVTLKEWALTIPNELSHVLDFIERYNGMTPEEVCNEDDSNFFEFNIEERLNDFDLNDGLDMEERAEDRAHEWLKKIQFNGPTLSKIIKHFTPSNSEVFDHTAVPLPIEEEQLRFN